MRLFDLRFFHEQTPPKHLTRYTNAFHISILIRGDTHNFRLTLNSGDSILPVSFNTECYNPAHLFLQRIAIRII
jgi:hypothetical protein